MRRRSRERVRLWRDVIDAWKRSGQTVNAFCRELTRSNFDRWWCILASQPAKSRPSHLVRVRVGVRARRPGSDPKRVALRSSCPPPKSGVDCPSLPGPSEDPS
jgi:hypothetical protein